jgi:hypothetical protein
VQSLRFKKRLSEWLLVAQLFDRDFITAVFGLFKQAR